MPLFLSGSPPFSEISSKNKHGVDRRKFRPVDFPREPGVFEVFWVLLMEFSKIIVRAVIEGESRSKVAVYKQHSANFQGDVKGKTGI